MECVWILVKRNVWKRMDYRDNEWATRRNVTFLKTALLRYTYLINWHCIRNYFEELYCWAYANVWTQHNAILSYFYWNTLCFNRNNPCKLSFSFIITSLIKFIPYPIVQAIKYLDQLHRCTDKSHCAPVTDATFGQRNLCKIWLYMWLFQTTWPSQCFRSLIN